MLLSESFWPIEDAFNFTAEDSFAFSAKTPGPSTLWWGKAKLWLWNRIKIDLPSSPNAFACEEVLWNICLIKLSRCNYHVILTLQIFKTMPQGHTGPLLGRPHTSLADKCPDSSSSQRRNRPKVPHPNFLSLTFSFTANLFGFKSVTKSFAVQRELHFDSLQLWSLLPNCCLIDQVLPETLWSKKIKKSTRVLAKMALNVQEICIDS